MFFRSKTTKNNKILNKNVSLETSKYVLIYRENEQNFVKKLYFHSKVIVFSIDTYVQNPKVIDIIKAKNDQKSLKKLVKNNVFFLFYPL